MTRRDAQDYARVRRVARSGGIVVPVTHGITLEDRRANWHSNVRMPWPEGVGIEPRSRTSALGEAVRMRVSME